MAAKERDLPHIGWREWVALPELGIPWIKAKVDTGARTSALHAYEIEYFRRRGERWTRFTVHPLQRDLLETIVVEAPVLEERIVRSSLGHPTIRPVIVTELAFAARRWPIEITLVSRDQMGFRMLLGRQAIRNRLLVDPGSSYHGALPPEAILRQNRRGLLRHRKKSRRPPQDPQA